MTDQSDEHIVDGEVVEPSPHDLAVADDVLPDTLHILPIGTRPYFPGQVQPVVVNMATWGQTDASSPSTTSPSTTAVGSINTRWPSCGAVWISRARSKRGRRGGGSSSTS